MALSPPYVDVADGQTVATSVVRALAVVAAAFILASILGQFALSALGVTSLEAVEADPVLYASVTALTFVGFLLASVGFIFLRRDRDLVYARVPTPSDLGWAVFGVLGLLVAAIAMGAVVEALSAIAEAVFGVSVTVGENSVITQGQRNPTLFLYMVPVALIFVGPAEELVFRGVVQGLFRRSFGVVPGLLGASLLFGVGHYFAISSGSAWTYILVAGALGLVLGALYEYTENIVVPAITHGLWNAGLFVVNYYVAVSGTQLPV